MASKVNDQVVSAMMEQLDYSKHDSRVTKDYVRYVLRAHYAQNLNSEVTAAQWDNMFTIYAPSMAPSSMVRKCFYIRPDQDDWLKTQSEAESVVLRQAIDEKMKKEEEEKRQN